MTQNLVTTVKSILYVGVVLSCLVGTPARAQVEVVIRPPSWFIATTWPVYFEGHASYWYGDRWYYRDGGAWRYYHDEPTYLRDHRGGHERGRQFYGRTRGGAGDRGGGRQRR